MAIRRPDSYVGKPADAGTDVFAMDTGNSSSTIPAMDSGFPVDFALGKYVAQVDSWGSSARLTGTKYLVPDSSSSEATNSAFVFDSNTGIWTGFASTVQAWMWKRHVGFDVVTWTGTNTSVVRNHNLGKTPEMIWFKNRSSSSRNWRVYHKGLNGGTNPEDYAVSLNSSSAEASNTSYMTGTAPTSTTFVAGNDDDTNGFGNNYIAMLFASVDGISKVGEYTGSNGSASPGQVAQTITTGFSPRFVIIKEVSPNGGSWLILDTTRGWGAGNDAYLSLDQNSAQSNFNFGAPTATGFTLTYDELGYYNSNGDKYIYYAHA